MKRWKDLDENHQQSDFDLKAFFSTGGSVFRVVCGRVTGGGLSHGQTKQRPCGGFLSHSSSRLCSVLGRRLKGVVHAKNGEEEHPLTAWGPGEPGERGRSREAFSEPGSAATGRHCKNDCPTSSSLLNYNPILI